MYSDIPFWLSLVLTLGGLAVLAWSSDVFVDGSAAVAKALGISPFIIGMVIIGSNLFNTLAVVGLATVISPLVPGANGEPAFSRYILTHDIPLMTVPSLSILFFGIN